MIVLLAAVLAVAVTIVTAFGDDDAVPGLSESARGLIAAIAPKGASEEELEAAAGKVYDDASYLFRESILRDKFVLLAVDIQRTLGAFEEVVKVVDEEAVESVVGYAVRVDFVSRFERATARCSVSYHRKTADDEWRLLGVQVVIPEHLRGEGVGRQHSPYTEPADPVLREEVLAVLEDVRDDDGALVYRRASAALRAKGDESAFLEKLAKQRAVLGKFVRVISWVRSGEDKSGRRARVYAVIEYEQASASGTFEFRLEQREGEQPSWVLDAYRVVPPEPVLPAR